MGGRDPSFTRAMPERFRDEFLMIKRYTNLRLLYLAIGYSAASFVVQCSPACEYA